MIEWLTREDGLIDLFNQGGFAMWILLALSIIAVAVIIERVITLARARLNPKKFVGQIKEEIDRGGTKAGVDLCDRTASPIAKVFAPAIAKYKMGKDAIEEAIAKAGTTELAFLDRGMLILAAVATVAPLVGFLGTVIGMISAFGTIQRAGEVNPADVAGGISQALITTATGLIIAAPVAIIHAFFTSRINSYTRDMEDGANDLVEYLLETKEKAE
jgi:biopolymer transport protein ExbB